MGWEITVELSSIADFGKQNVFLETNLTVEILQSKILRWEEREI